LQKGFSEKCSETKKIEQTREKHVQFATSKEEAQPVVNNIYNHIHNTIFIILRNLVTIFTKFLLAPRANFDKCTPVMLSYIFRVPIKSEANTPKK